MIPRAKIPLISLILFVSVLSAHGAHAYQVRFSPRITLSEEYTDNLYLTKDNTEDDFITTIKPGFTLSLLGRKAEFDLSYDPSYSWYRENHKNNTFRHDARLNAWSDISKNTRIFLNDAFIYTEEPYTENDLTSRTQRDPYYRNSATIGMTQQFGRSNSLSLQYMHGILENDDKNTEDSVSQTPSASLSCWFGPHFGLSTGLSYTRGEFDLPDDSDAIPSDDFENYDGNIRLIKKFSGYFEAFAGYRHTAMVYDDFEDNNYHTDYPHIGFNYDLMEDTHVSLSGGYLMTDRRKGDDDERFLAGSNISKVWRFRRGLVNVAGSSGYDESYFDPENLGLRVYYGANGNISYEFFRDITGRLSAAYRTDDYLDTADERQDRTTTGGLGLTCDRLRYLVAAIDYRYRRVNSSEKESEYQENRISFSLTLKPDRDLFLKK